MLKGIDPRISPELLYVLAQMGHGDDLAIVDQNFPATSIARGLPHNRVLTIGSRLNVAVTLVTNLMPLDPFVPAASLPTRAQVSPAVQLWQPRHGGHVGFSSGAWPAHVLAMPRAVTAWLAQWLAPAQDIKE